MARKQRSKQSQRVPKSKDQRKRAAPIEGTEVVWPAGVELRYGISSITRWRWERAAKLPARDVHIGGRSGWKPETLDEAQRVGDPPPNVPPQAAGAAG